MGTQKRDHNFDNHPYTFEKFRLAQATLNEQSTDSDWMLGYELGFGTCQSYTPSTAPSPSAAR